MTQPTARTGPAGLVRPTTNTRPIRQPQNTELEAALDRVRTLAARPTPPPTPESARFSIETARVLAEKAPDLYAMTPEVAGRFRLIATFLDTALDEIGPQR